MELSSVPDYYEVLQVSRGAQPLIINKAFRLLAAMYHPDNGQSGDPEAFRLVLEAHRILSDPMRRAAYDREQSGGVAADPRVFARPAGDEREAPEECVCEEREVRSLILEALYHARRNTPGRPSISLMAIPELFGCSIDAAQFTLWYLRGKKLIEMTDDGMAITIAGVDAVEAGWASEPADLRSLSSPRPMIEASYSGRELPREWEAAT